MKTSNTKTSNTKTSNMKTACTKTACTKIHSEIKINNLKKEFDRFSLNIENLSVPQGKIYGIIGANGCGKTTIMKIISGLITPDSGLIDYAGLTPRDITMVFRKPYLMHDTVIKNLMYPLTLRKITPDNEKVEYYLKIAELYDIKNEYAPALSGGQQQKLALIRAFIFSPRLIIIDEGFSNLDIESTGLFEQLILDRQKKEPVTYIICAHQLSHIQRLCGHIFFMHNGMVEEEGSADEILLKPKSLKLQNYLRFAV